jgi:succinate dehydrogenase/fumarate reductase flavoprotein subunit
MSNKEKNTNKIVAKKNNVNSIVAKVLSDKEAYSVCSDKLESALKLITEVIVISGDNTNIIPSSVVARFVHLHGKLSGSRNEQFIVGYERIVKRNVKAKAKVLRDENKAVKAKESLKALQAKIEKLTKDSESKTVKAKELSEKLSAVKM